MSAPFAESRVEHDCVGALLVRDGHVLLGRRADDRAWLPGAWDLFGGHIAPGETAEQALRRELQEELGIAPFAMDALGELASADGDWRLQVFAVRGWQGEARNRQPREHAELRWMTVTEAQAYLSEAHPAFAAMIASAFAAASQG